MRTLLLILTTSVLVTSCTVKSKLLTDIEAHRVWVATHASYNVKLEDLSNKLEKTIASEYPIEYKSDSKRIINSEALYAINLDSLKSTKTWVESRINGKQQPYEVLINVYDQAVGVANGLDIRNSINKQLQNAMYIKFYENVNGKIPLSKPLKTRITDYNNDCKKEKRKINY